MTVLPSLLVSIKNGTMRGIMSIVCARTGNTLEVALVCEEIRFR